MFKSSASHLFYQPHRSLESRLEEECRKQHNDQMDANQRLARDIEAGRKEILARFNAQVRIPYPHMKALLKAAKKLMPTATQRKAAGYSGVYYKPVFEALTFVVSNGRLSIELMALDGNDIIVISPLETVPVFTHKTFRFRAEKAFMALFDLLDDDPLYLCHDFVSGELTVQQEKNRVRLPSYEKGLDAVPFEMQMALTAVGFWDILRIPAHLRYN